MIDYRAGVWGFHVACGLTGSLAPRAFVMAVPNAIITFIIASLMEDTEAEETVKSAEAVLAVFSSVMFFVLYNRSNTAYDRWWEGGTLLQKTRGEWFNAYSSIMAFTSTKPEMQEAVDQYCGLLARLMSMLMCCGLQQVSPDSSRPFEILDPYGIEPASLDFLSSAPDKVEIILQWIQRSMVLHAQTGVLPVPPPILSRAFQEVSRGIVNLQNARKIADFPYPYPLAQVSMILLLAHWAMTPVAAAFAFSRMWATGISFITIFVIWCVHFNALDLEFPFGTRENDLPMSEMQSDWNKSLCTLLAKRAQRPPEFRFDPSYHDKLLLVMSDGRKVETLSGIEAGLKYLAPKDLGPCGDSDSERSGSKKSSRNYRNKGSKTSVGAIPPVVAAPAVERKDPPPAAVNSAAEISASVPERKGREGEPEKKEVFLAPSTAPGTRSDAASLEAVVGNPLAPSEASASLSRRPAPGESSSTGAGGVPIVQQNHQADTAAPLVSSSIHPVGEDI